MKHYPKYRCSSCDWLQSIPEEWSTKRIKSLFRLRDERSYKPLSEVNLISLYAGLGVRQQKDIERTTGNKARNADGYKIVYKNDIVVNILLCWMGAIGSSDYYGVTSPAYDVYKAIVDLNTKYYSYLFRTPFFSRQCYRNGKGIMAMRLRTYSPQFLSIVVPFPPRSEQDQIVKFLDWKISCINKLIGIKKREIQCLRRAKESNIKEIIDDLKCNFRLKNIAKSYGRIGFRGYSTVDLVEKGHGAITTSPSNISDMGMNFEQCSYLSWEKYEESPEIQLKKGDILVVKTGSSYGKTGFVDSLPLEATINPQLLIIRADSDNVIPEYLFYSIKYGAIQEQINKGIIGSTIPTISESRIMSYRLSIPEVGIQKKRLEKIKNLEFRYNKLIHTFEKSIMELNNLKVRVVSDVVTGKFDVRNIEIPEYEFVEEENDTVANSDNKEGPEE